MSGSELIISAENKPLVALGMTSASFDSAQRAGVTHVEADTDAMDFIARRIGYIKPSEVLSPLVIITRDSSDTRALIGRWDDRLPIHQGSPNTGRFFLANNLDEKTPLSANKEIFVEVAKTIGTTALTEISLSSWQEGVSHAGDFAAGLLTGRRPLDLPPKPSALRAVSAFFTVESAASKAINAVRNDPGMPEPFIITRQPINSEPQNPRQIGG